MTTAAASSTLPCSTYFLTCCSAGVAHHYLVVPCLQSTGLKVHQTSVGQDMPQILPY